MESEQITLVRESWKKIQAVSVAAGARFYVNLFALNPALRAMFPADIEQQGWKLVHMLGLAVARLDHAEILEPLLRNLAQRHVDYGVREEHYRDVGSDLIQTLSDMLGDQFTAGHAEAWNAAYAHISHLMITATATD